MSDCKILSSYQVIVQHQQEYKSSNQIQITKALENENFDLDISNCLVHFWRNKYCPKDKQLNRSLCLKELRMGNERSMAQCKLGMHEIENKYRDKKRRLVGKYYGTDDFDLAEKQISRILEIDEQFLLDLICLRKDRKTLTVYAIEIQKFASINNDLGYYNGNNNNNNNNERKDERKDNNSNDKMHVSNEVSLSQLDIANNNINLINDDNDINEIEEMTIDETKFVEDVTKSMQN